MDDGRCDSELLRAFVLKGDQQAFAAVVRRHINLVYATALRKLADEGCAEEVTQDVFAALARNAWRFSPDNSLAAWLYRTTLLKAKQWLRGELRRRRREQTAAELGTTTKNPEEQTAFCALVPLLDEALLSLREKDRAALLLRFYESQSLRDVGTALGVSEDAAQKRVAGGLEALCQFFQRRGYRTATVAASAAALQHTAASASASTANVVVNTALQAAPPALGGLMSLLARLAGLTRVQKAIVCLALVTAPVVWLWSEARVEQKETTRRPADIELVTAQEEHEPAARREFHRGDEAERKLESSTPVIGGSRPENQETVRLTGVVDLPQYKAALLEVHLLVTVRSNTIFQTNHIILKEGQSWDRQTFKGALLVLEVLQVNSADGSIEARQNGEDAHFALEAQDDAGTSGGEAQSSKPVVRLQGANSSDVLEVYAELVGRAVLCHPAVKRSSLSLATFPRDRTAAARAVQQLLKENGVSAFPDGDKFELAVPNELAQRLLKTVKPPPTPTSTNEEVIPGGAICFTGVGLPEVLMIYGELIGRKLVESAPPAPGFTPFSFRNQTPLTKAEAIYAFDTLLAWRGLKVVYGSDKSFKTVRMLSESDSGKREQEPAASVRLRSDL